MGHLNALSRADFRLLNGLRTLGWTRAQVEQTIDKVSQLLRQPRHKKSWLDVHSGNVMFRPGRVRLRPVLTDPIGY